MDVQLDVSPGSINLQILLVAGKMGNGSKTEQVTAFTHLKNRKSGGYRRRLKKAGATPQFPYSPAILMVFFTLFFTVALNGLSFVAS
jgi:hypothetical protein